VWLEGSKYISTNISYGDNWRQLFFWKLSIPYDNQYAMELWPDYKIEKGCSIEFDIQFIQSGSPDTILFHKRYSEEELSSPIVFSNASNGYLVCSVFVKGNGLVQVGHVYYRHSRLGAGEFLPGGKRILDRNRQELFYYFYPSNLKPPLNIYFSGYRLLGGFEGYYMMKKLGHPFLLIADHRLEGGSFHVGSSELENKLQETIREHIDLLGIKEEDAIFSGIGMGAFGALYYGSMFRSHAIIACKPITDIEYVASRARLVRPYEFLTALDLSKYWERADDDGKLIPLKEFHEAVRKKWSEGAGFGDTKLLIAHMEQDDYDDKAYYNLLETQSGKQTTIIARGYEGRNNDQNPKIVDWFTNQYNRVVKEYEEGKG
jgi:accessory secretory protein Asp2